MNKKLIWNDIKQNKLSSGAALFFMAVSATLLALTVLLFSGLLGAIEGLMDKAQVPDYMQMHAKEGEDGQAGWQQALCSFAEEHGEVRGWQLCGFLELNNTQITLGGHSLGDSTQDNGLCLQGERFDYLLDMENQIPQVLPGEVYVPVCYRDRYQLSVGDTMVIGNAMITDDTMAVGDSMAANGAAWDGGGCRLVIAGFIRDGQMNSMMASSKRFLVNQADYGRIKAWGNAREEYLVEFLLHEGTDTNAFAQAYAEAGLPANGPAITRPLVKMMNALSDGTMIFVLLLVSLVVVLISLLCIRFLCLTQMERERREVGMLKALGIGRRDIVGLYFGKYLLLSGCGALLGLLGAGLLKRPLERQVQELYGAAPKDAGTAALGLAAVLAVQGSILLSLRRSLKKTEKLSVLEALFPDRGREAGAGGRWLMGMVAAAGAFLILVPQNLYHTMSAPDFVAYMGIGQGEIRMDLGQRADIDSTTKQIVSRLARDAQVDKYVVLRTSLCRAVLPEGGTVSLKVETGDHSAFPVKYLEGAAPEGAAEIALSSMNAEELGVSLGDTLLLSVEGRERAYTVCGIYSDITNGGRTGKARQVGRDTPALWSVLYVSLKDSRGKEQWMESYRQMGAEGTDINTYVRDTYGQTLEQLRLASLVATAIAVLVTAVVAALFMRLLVEKDRYVISLYKALGYTGREMKGAYFGKGLFLLLAGVAAGLVLGNLLGERLCGMALRSFGADSFRFVVSWPWVLLGIPCAMVLPAALAVWGGIGEIGQVGAWECCNGKGQT